jgi:hypothetical protein
MPKKSAPKRDFMEVARGIVEQAIGEQMDGTDLPAAPTRKQLAGAKGGEKGGVSRAKILTADQKRQIAVKAAQARWRKPKGD